MGFQLLKNYLTEIFYPQNCCTACGNTFSKQHDIVHTGLTGSDKRIYKRFKEIDNLCSVCKMRLSIPLSPYCYYCHKPIREKVTINSQLACDDCKEKIEGTLEFNRSSILYNDYAKELISLYKYRGKESLATLFSNLLVIAYDEFLAKEVDVITFVPIHKNRLSERGFNQSEILAKNLHRYASKPIVNALEKIKDTKKQSKQGKWDRLLEIQDSFTINGEIIPLLRNKNILLIDDIYTTGFTVKECAQILKESGARRVYSLTLARAIEINNDK